MILSVGAVWGCASVECAREAQRRAALPPEASAARLSIKDVAPIEGHASANLPELVAYALTNRPSVVSAELAVCDAQLTLKQIAADAPLISPTPWNAAEISVSGGHSESSRGTKLDDHTFKTYGNASGALSLDLLLYDFGRNAASAKAQAERVIAAEVSLIEARHTVFKDLVSAYFTCREKEALLTVAETNVVTCAVRLEQVETKKREGEAMPLDVTRAKLELAQARESLVAASNDVISAGAEFVYAIGLPSVDSSGASIVTLPETEMRLAPIAAEDIVLTNAPAVRLAAARVRAASHDVDKAIADLYPTLSASASLSWTDPLWYIRWGFTGAQSLFTGWRKTTAVDRSVVALQSAVASRDETLLALARDLELTLTARQKAREAIVTAGETLKTAEENFALVDEQVKIGEANRVDWADAERSVTDARAAVIRAEAGAQRAEAALYALLGLKPIFVRD